MEQYLQHHGILGQKWGVRRYQNYDGTLTDAGRKKLAKAESLKEKAKEYKAKVPSRYATDFGKAKAEKYTRKAANAEGKAYKIEKKVNKLKKQVDEEADKYFKEGSREIQNSKSYSKKYGKYIRAREDLDNVKMLKKGYSDEAHEYLMKSKYGKYIEKDPNSYKENHQYLYLDDHKYKTLIDAYNEWNEITNYQETHLSEVSKHMTDKGKAVADELYYRLEGPWRFPDNYSKEIVEEHVKKYAKYHNISK